MKTKSTIKLVTFGILAFLFPFTAGGCSFEDFTITPNFFYKRLLFGDEVGTSGDFVYYTIDGETGYAVGLSEAGKAKTSINLNDAAPNGNDEDGWTYNGHTITGIWHDAFRGSNATSVVISDTIDTIDYEAFMGSKIETITIPNTVKKIGEGAFYSCTSLTSATFGASAAEGGADDCNCSTAGATTTPLLTKIPAFCFFQCKSLEEVFLPSTITEIAEEAFNGCKNLSNNIYLNSITTIRSRAFQSCGSLSNVFISSSMFEGDNKSSSAVGIASKAFLYCSSSLNVTFFGDTADIGDSSTSGTWIYNHPNWGIYNDAGAAYTPTIKDGSAYATALWNFTVDGNNEVTLTKYLGATPEAFITIPSTMATAPTGNKVTRIATDAFEPAVKTAIRRLYLPTTLKAIENSMFDSGYTNLTVIASSKECEGDSIQAASNASYFNTNGKIDLHNLKELQFIGDNAFSGMNQRDNVKKVHLPARLIAVGSNLFSVWNSNRFKFVNEFIWDYVDPDVDPTNGSRLEVVGKQAFHLLGENVGNTKDDFSADAKYNSSRSLTTLVFPRTFKHFGLTPNDKTRYTNDYGFTFSINLDTNSNKRPDLIFAGSPLLRKVIFKGSSDSSKTSDLFIPVQTFTCNHNLQTIIFEERQGKTITFSNVKYADQNNWNSWGGDQAIGAAASNSSGNVDFRSTPMIQTIILPTQNTSIRLREYALGGNARAALYLSGSETFIANTEKKEPVTQIDSGFSDSGTISHYKVIGKEASIGNGRATRGYDLVTNGGDYSGKNTFNIDQQMPVYTNIHYKETIKDALNNDVTVELGSTNTNELVLDAASQCAFVCDSTSSPKVATMSNFLYDLHKNGASDTAFNGTATVPQEITVTGTNAGTYTVTKVGKSAFSACYCDNKDGGKTTDLTNVILPSTITEIGEYAFARAYNLQNVHVSGGADYVMPSSLTRIGKHAFIFSGVKQILKIPYICVFFENTNDNNNELNTSVFSNCLSLRKITFLNGSGADGNESKFYKATSYTSANSGTPTYTSALYSKNSSNSDGFTKYKNRLLLVLSRDKKDWDKASEDFTLLTGDSYKTFDCKWKPADPTNPSTNLYGALKMGYWIKKINVNPQTNKVEPLISAVCSRANNTSEITKKDIYLGKPVYEANTNKIACDLEEITGSVFALPQYAFAGCEKLHIVELINNSGGNLPTGVFANVDNTDMKYKTGGPEGSESYPGVLDLTGTGYNKVGSETFRNNDAITKFVAPNRENFTVDTYGFYDCDNLEIIDFSNVTGTLTLNKDCFAQCDKLKQIIWPDSATSIVISDESFAYCGASATGTSAMEFPTINNLTIGKDAFRNSPYINAVDFSEITGTLTLKDRCFARCENITSIVWPTDPTAEVDLKYEGMFCWCSGLVDLALPQNVKADSSGKRCVGSIDDGAGVNKNEERGVFQGCVNLERVFVDPDPTDGNHITSNITDIMNAVFREDNKLTDFVFDDFPNITWLHRDFLGGGWEQADWNEGRAAAYGNGDTDLVLPASLTVLGRSCFSGCGVRSITFQSPTLNTDNSNNNERNKNQFMRSRNLRMVKFPADCTLGANFYKSVSMFEGCSELLYVLLPQHFYATKPAMSNFVTSANKVNLLIQGKYKEITSGERTNLNADNGNWRKSDGNTIKPINWQIDTTPATAMTDVLNGSSLDDKVTNYWVMLNGEPVVLGNAVSYEGGVITFKSGATLSSSGFVVS